MKYQSIKGTKDILWPEIIEWRKIETIARGVFKTFGYSEIRTPIIEETGLFIKSVGEDTDIVKKEMFSFKDRGDRDISLRPEGTAPIVRAYVEHNLDKTEPFQKLYYMGPMFRAERPQAGRLRQFQQIGVEAIGSDNPALDAEVIFALTELLDSVGIKDYALRMNNLGCHEDKKKLSVALKKTFSKNDITILLCDDCKRRIRTNPLRILDCKNENCKIVVRKHFKEIDFLCPGCKTYFNEVLQFLDLLDIKYTIDPYIVRGLDYYTRTVFEVTHIDLGAQNAVGAGGRYDNLIHDMGGPKIGACGFALGVDRLLALRVKYTMPVWQRESMAVFIATLGAAAYKKGYSLMGELRKNDIACDIDYENSSLKSQMRTADKFGAKFVYIIGDNELKNGSAVLRDMKTTEQRMVKFEDAAKVIKDKAGRC